MITCPRCLATSYHPEDERQGYCARCHWWTSDPVLGQIEPPERPTSDWLVEDDYHPERMFALIVVILVCYGLGFLTAWACGAF